MSESREKGRNRVNPGRINPLMHFSGPCDLRSYHTLNEQNTQYTGWFLNEFRPKVMAAPNKNRKIKIFFIPYETSTYSKNSTCNSVEFRFKSEGCSNYRGLLFCLRQKWGGQICVADQRIFLGRFKDEIEAAKAYEKAAKKHFGEFTKMNF